MSFLDRWFGSENADDYIDLEQLNKQEIAKSFRAGRSDQRVDNAYIQIGADSHNRQNPQREKINQDYYLRKKDQLRAYADDLLVQAIIRTRTNQILNFATPARLSSDDNGFRVVKKGKQISDMTTHEKNVAKKLEDFIFYTGKDQLDWRDDFPTFLAKIIYDFYVFDQVNIERVYESKRSNKLNHFNHVDASTVLIDKYPTSIDKPKSFVQVVNSNASDKDRIYFNSKELVFSTYWSQDKPYSGGYGFSPVEAGMEHIQYHINVEQFNARFFSQGGMTRGLLLLDPGDGSGTTQSNLDALRRNLTPAQGINGSWKIPIIQAHDAKYVNMTQSSKDMEFVNFLNYLNNIICADFNIQPDEINFPNRGGANGKTGGSTLNEGNTTRTKIDASRNNGLEPVMKYIERLMTDKILRYVDSDYMFVFSPSDQGKEKQLQDELALKLKNGMTINEARCAMHLSKLDIPDIPGNSDNLIQWLAIQDKMNPEANAEQQHQNDYKPGHEQSLDKKPDAKEDPNKQDLKSPEETNVGNTD